MPLRTCSEADRDGDRLVLGRKLGAFVKNRVVLAGPGMPLEVDLRVS
jgi:hypothetical protein